MLMNFYGVGDNFDLEISYVVLVFIWKFYEVKVLGVEMVIVWGIGKLKREFMYVDDCVDVLVYLVKNYLDMFYVNVGVGEDVIIKELVFLV